MATDPRRVLVERLFTLERLSSQLGDQAERLIRELFDEIAAELARLDPAGGAVRYQQGRLDKLRERVRELAGATYDEIHRGQRASLAAIGARQARDATIELRAVIGAGSAGKLAPTTGLGVNYFKAIIDTRPLQGALFREWVKKQGTDTAFRVEQQVRLGMVGGETIDQMVRRVRGRRIPGGYTGGVMQTSTRQARTLVRTAVNDVSNTARMDTFGANADIISAVTFVATLDERTCVVCGGLDGKRWKVGDPEIRQPPLHFSDRCTLVPEIDWESLGMDPPPDGTRASRDGQVPSSTMYQDWLRGLSPEEQDEILGPARAALFRNGQVTLTQLVTSDGQRRTVGEVGRDAIRFARGRGDPAIKAIGGGGVLPSPRQFSPAPTKESAIAYAKEHFADEVDYGDLTLDQVNRINEGFDRVLRESLITGGNYRIGRIYLDPSLPEKEHMQWNPVGMGGDDRRGTIAISPDYVAGATRTTLPANIDYLRKKGSHYVSEIADDGLRSTAAHEAGHAVYHNDVMHLSFEHGWGEANLTKDDKAYVSRYAMKESHRNDHYEVFAEVTAAIVDGNRKFMPPNVLRLYDSVINDAKIRLGYPK